MQYEQQCGLNMLCTIGLLTVTGSVWRYSQLGGDQLGEVLVPLPALALVEEVYEEDAEDDEESSNTKEHWASNLERVLADLRRSGPVRDDRHRHADKHHPDGDHDQQDGERVAARRHRPPLHAGHLGGLDHSLLVLVAHWLRTVVLRRSS